MKKFLARVTDNRKFSNTISEFGFLAPDMATAIKIALHNEGYKRVAKIYKKTTSVYSALLSNKKFAEKFIDTFSVDHMEEE